MTTPDIQAELKRCVHATMNWERWYAKCAELRDRGETERARRALAETEKYAAILAEIDMRWSYRDPRRH